MNIVQQNGQFRHYETEVHEIIVRKLHSDNVKLRAIYHTQTFQLQTKANARANPARHHIAE